MLDRVMRCTGSLRSCVGRLAVGCFLAAGLAGPAVAQTPVTSAFTYQGRLSNTNGPIDGNADLVVTLFNAASGGSALGTVNLNNVSVVDGLFTAALDFGVYGVDEDARWIEIAV